VGEHDLCFGGAAGECDVTEELRECCAKDREFGGVLKGVAADSGWGTAGAASSPCAARALDLFRGLGRCGRYIHFSSFASVLKHKKLLQGDDSWL